jgi:hypothetical protein
MIRPVAAQSYPLIVLRSYCYRRWNSFQWSAISSSATPSLVCSICSASSASLAQINAIETSNACTLSLLAVSTLFSGRTALTWRFWSRKTGICGSSRPDRTLARSSCLARAQAAVARPYPAVTCNVGANGGPLCLRATSGAATVTRHTQRCREDANAARVVRNLLRGTTLASGNGVVQRARIIAPVTRATIVLTEAGSCARALWTRPKPTTSVAQENASITTFRCVRRSAASSEKLFITRSPKTSLSLVGASRRKVQPGFRNASSACRAVRSRAWAAFPESARGFRRVVEGVVSSPLLTPPPPLTPHCKALLRTMGNVMSRRVKSQ